MKFTKNNLTNEGGYICFHPSNGERAFPIARFKPGQSGAGTFMTHLRKHWTVEAYLEAFKTEAPLAIVKRTGYLQPHVKKVLKRNGYPLTDAGFKQYIRDEAERRNARQ